MDALRQARTLLTSGHPLQAAGALGRAVVGENTARQAARDAVEVIQAGDPTAPVTLGSAAKGGIARTVERGLVNTPASQQRMLSAFDAQDVAIKGSAGAVADRITLEKQSCEWKPEDRDIADGLIQTLGRVDWQQARMAWILADQAQSERMAADATAQWVTGAQALAGQPNPGQL